ncbi:hypothetical protein Glove_216g110 [Diversispora epigaea]|uniref:4'-phosphopantetheinyl transferase domain-containing protein n=1 Tax=Diversispora epigaea TaxID=1348612 RepID=A0A397IH90_9GLOM|nr:hypothetical protein Glove_216g110 [Diversispora epigaea]
MILGIGVDIIHLPRIYSLITRNFPRQFKRFVTRILDSDEIKEFYSIFPINNEGDNMIIDNYNHPVVQYLAVRWSIKEAAYKALYPNYKATWKDLSVKKFEEKPHLFIHKNVELKNIITHSSVSHDGEYVIAQVLIECV